MFAEFTSFAFMALKSRSTSHDVIGANKVKLIFPSKLSNLDSNPILDSNEPKNLASPRNYWGFSFVLWVFSSSLTAVASLG